MKRRLVTIQSALLVILFMPALAFAAAQPTDSQSQATGNTGFVPLTSFPQIKSLADSQGFGDFVNTFYKILIGAGAVLAVIMIMVAGAQFMTSRGSVASNEKAKSRIQNALLGLLLILSPVIVFGIINPSILKLNLGTEFGGLQQQKINQAAFGNGTSGVYNNVLWSNQGNVAQDSARCTASGGSLKQTCVASDSSNNFTPVNGQCASGQTLENFCFASSAVASGDSCRIEYKNITSAVINNGSPNGQQCNASNGYVAIPSSCCSTAAFGNICCGIPANAPSTPPASGDWGWVAKFTGGGGTGYQRGGPFSTKQACVDSQTAFLKANPNLTMTEDVPCSCAQPMSSQPNCHL